MQDRFTPWGIAAGAATIVGGMLLDASGLRARDWVPALGGTSLLLLGGTATALVLVRRWLALAEERQLRTAEVNTAAQRRRLIMINPNPPVADASQRVAELEHELQEMLDEYNLLVIETLQSRHDRFNLRTWGVSTLYRRTTPTQEHRSIPPAASRRDKP